VRVLVCLLINICLCLPALSDEHGKSEKAQDESDCVTHVVTNSATNVTNTITRCSGESVSNLVHKKPEPKKTNNTDENKTEWYWKRSEIVDDFGAQTSMADSTYWIMLFTSVGLVISAAGLGYLIRTVSQNTRTFDHIKDASFQELRGYLRIHKPKVDYLSWSHMGAGDIGIRFTAKIKNIGKTPIYNVGAPTIDLCDFDYGSKRAGISTTKYSHEVIDPVSRTIPIINPGEAEQVFFCLALYCPSNIDLSNFADRLRPPRTQLGGGCTFSIKFSFDYDLFGSEDYRLRTATAEVVEGRNFIPIGKPSIRILQEGEKEKEEKPTITCRVIRFRF